MIAKISEMYNCQYFGTFWFVEFLETIIANISENFISGFLKIMIANVRRHFEKENANICRQHF